MDEKKNILIYYGVFFISFVIAIIPVSVASVFATMICACVLAAIYVERAKADKESFIYNHMTFLIKSFWRGNLYLLITLTIALIYLLFISNYDTFGTCVDAMLHALNKGNFSRMGTLAHACEQLFFKQNSVHLKTAAVIAFAPIVVYLLYRCTYGWMHGTHKKLVPDNKL